VQATPQHLVDWGARHRWRDGPDTVLARLDCAPLELPGGRLTFHAASDFSIVGGVRPVLASVALSPGRHAAAVSVVEVPPWRDAPRGGRSAAAAVIGATGDVVTWRPATDASGRPLGFDVDYLVGCAFAAERLAEVAAALASHADFDAVTAVVRKDGWTPVMQGGRLVAIAFGCGLASSWCPVYLGENGAGQTLAALADLELLHHATGLVPG
jgi:hypothetical protein